MTAKPLGPEGETALRLLPWSSPDGKPCYLAPGDGYSPLSQRADEIEALQLNMGAQLLQHAHALLSDRKVSSGELRYLGHRLTEALRDVLRVAESRGGRLLAYGDDEGVDLGNDSARNP
ncbi:hypothetical protein ACFZCY_00350 [Streptomyces sp. NPDC007983]|uniref:hypothetical protein n=1 Tax=Streptomyces sp. NPDC007983 TaxID=3364800 RepID=UPI0036E4ED80